MDFFLIDDQYSWHSNKYKKIFQKAYPNKKVFIIKSDLIFKKELKKGDLVLSFKLDYFEKMKEISDFIYSKKAKFGLFFGDSLQYLDQVYRQYCCLIDFCFTHELGESSLYEMLLGIPSFDHPIFQPNSISHIHKKSNYLDFKKRDITFTHLGLIDHRRESRHQMLDSLRQLNCKYKLYGTQKEFCEYLKTEEIEDKLSNCIFGLTPCAASSSNSLTKNEKFIKYQFKGKIWEYMISGCIPVLDHAPMGYKNGLKDGIHYLSVSSFDKKELGRISQIQKKVLSEISKNAFSASREILSIENFRLEFDVFLNNLYETRFNSRKKITFSTPSSIEIACFEYSFLRKRLSFNILKSGIYFIKLKNTLFRLLYKSFKR